MAITMGWQGTRAWNDLGRAEEKAAEPIRPWTCELMIPQVMVADTHIKGTREQQR